MTATTRTRTRTWHRARALVFATVLAITGLGLQASPVEVPRPAELAPEPALAYACADGPEFEGWLTDSTGSHPNITTSSTGDVYAWISKVVDDWSCTAFYRYDGIVWARSATNGNFAWGNLIHSTSVSCNWELLSNDYIKANSTSDCPDSDAEYAYLIHLGDTSAATLFEGTLQNDASPGARGDTAFIHSDCESYYGASTVKWNQPFGTGDGPRPSGGVTGDNCDPYDLDGFENTIDLTVDGTDPAPPSIPDLASASDTGTSNIDNITNDTTPTFTGSAEANATVTLYDGAAAVGTDVLAVSETAWSIMPTLGAGTHTITAKAEDVAGNPSSASGALPVTIDTAAPGAPSIPDLVTASDTGTSSTDNITSDTTPEFTGSAEANATVRLYDGAFERGSHSLTNNATAWSITPALALALGSHSITARATDLAGNPGAASGALPVTISTTGPAATYSATPATPTNALTLGYTLTFGEPVTGLAASDFAVSGTATGWTVGAPSGTGAGPYTLSLSGGGAGTVVLTLAASSVTGTATTGPSAPTAAPAVTVDRTAPAAVITTPEGNRALGGPVTLTGTATDPTFKDYRLEYGTGTLPATWTTIGTYTTAVTGGTLGTWSPGSLSGVYTIRLTVTDLAGNTSQATRTVVLENSMRGDEAYYTRVPYDLGGGWALDIGVANGEARLVRDLFTIPSYGPAQALSLTYSSADAGAAGRFGVGWSSNLTQHLAFDIAGAVTTWHRADGGRVPFGLVAGTWMPPRGHHETMAVAGAEVTITTPDQTRHVFESSGAGRLKRIENRFGKALALDWSATPLTVEDESGRRTSVTIDAANNRITGATDSAGRAWTFGYTGTGTGSDLTCITDPASKVTRLTYTAHALTKVSRGGATCAADGTTTWSVGYTGGKATSVTTPEVAHPDLFTYGSGTATWREVAVDAAATEYADTVHTLDAAGRGWVTATTTPEAALTERTFDDDGNVLTETSPDDGQVVVTYDYDTAGNVTREERVLERPDAADTEHPDGLVAVTRSTYNAANDLLTRTDADNDLETRTVTKYTYDAAGHLVSENRNCTSIGLDIPLEGQGGSCTGDGDQDASTNVITLYAYTANDQLAYEQDPRGFVTKHLYDTHGNETAVIANCTSSGTTPPSPFGSCTTTTRSDGGIHDGATNVVTETVYDTATTAGKAGLPTSTTDALGRTTTYRYDALGRQDREVLPGDTSTIPALTRETPYDEFGNAWTEDESWTPLGASEAVILTTTREFDNEQREISVIDPSGTTKTTTDYDPQGNVVEQVVKNVAGTITATTTEWTYDKDGNQKSEVLVGTTGSVTLQTATYTPSNLLHTASSGTTTQMATLEVGGTATVIGTYASDNLQAPLSETATTYDTLGNAVKTTSEINTVTTSTYDHLGRLVASTTAGRTTTYTYDRAGNQLSVTDPAGITTTTGYDALDRATTVIVNDVAGQSTVPGEDVTTTTWYDAAGNTVAVTDALGITTRSILNARDQVRRSIANCTDADGTPSTDPAGCSGGISTTTANVITDSTYDGQGNAIRTVAAVGLGTEYETTTETAYDAAGRVQATKDAMGTITRSVYNGAGQLTDTWVNCTSDNPATDWRDCAGDGTPDRVDGTLNLHTHYGYDSWGNQASVVAPNGRETRSLRDTSNRLTTTIDNYVNGVSETTDGSVTDDVATEYVYDDAGRQAAVRTASPTGSGTTITRTIFNDDGSVAQVIVNCTTSGTTVPTTDAAALACTGTGTQDADTNVTTSSTYDTEGRLVAVTAPDPSATTGTSTATVTTQYAYDDAGRLCRVVEHATSTTDLQGLTHPCTDATQTAGTATANTSTRYGYDGAGNLTSMTDASGHTTTYSYDAAGHPTGRTDADGGTLVWRYDALGNRTSQRNRVDPVPTNSVQWTHDPFGRILTRTADSTVTTYTYDLAGNRRTATTGTLVITATYDRLNRVLTVDDEDPDTTPDTTYTYSLTSPSWTDPTGSYTATLDAFDRPVAMTDPASASGWAWTYLAAGQAEVATAGNGNTTTSTHDATGRELTRTTRTGGTTRAAYTWTYNRAGLVLSEASTITGDLSNGSIDYAYGPLGRLTTSGSTGYTWDAATNRTGAGSSTTTFDAANRPTGGTSPTASYQSDADGRLIARPGQSHGLGPPRPARLGHHGLGHHDLHLRSPGPPAHGHRPCRRGHPLPLHRAHDQRRPAARRHGHRHKEHRQRLGRRAPPRLGPGHACHRSALPRHQRPPRHHLAREGRRHGPLGPPLRPLGRAEISGPGGLHPVPLPGLLARHQHRPRLGRHPLVRAIAGHLHQRGLPPGRATRSRLPPPLCLRGGGAGGELGPGRAVVVSHAPGDAARDRTRDPRARRCLADAEERQPNRRHEQRPGVERRVPVGPDRVAVPEVRPQQVRPAGIQLPRDENLAGPRPA